MFQKLVALEIVFEIRRRETAPIDHPTFYRFRFGCSLNCPCCGQLRYHQGGRSVSLEEAILDKVRRLPPAKQEEVLHFANGLQGTPAERVVPCRDRTREVKWIDGNRAAYADQWMAVEGDRLIAAGVDPLAVFAARTEGIQVPFVVHVIPEDPLPFVPGW